MSGKFRFGPRDVETMRDAFTCVCVCVCVNRVCVVHTTRCSLCLLCDSILQGVSLGSRQGGVVDVVDIQTTHMRKKETKENEGLTIKIVTAVFPPF